MAPVDVFSLSHQGPVTCHAFNGDRSQVAVSLNNNEVRIYARAGNDWNHIETLTEHDKPITSIDWAPNSNRIVTSAQDRNAYVWTLTPDPQTGHMTWKPTLVLLRINRAATYVRWSPNEDKFAVASGARAIAICSFDPEGDWWVSRLLKKPIRSTVLSVDWHPNNVLLAAGSADMKARVFSAYIRTDRPSASVWGEKLPFNTICGEYASPSGGWVHDVAFSPSGDVLAFVSHDSTVNIVYPGGPTVFTIKMSSLPLATLTWTTEESIVAAGHDCQPLVFAGNTTGWEAIGTLDDPQASKAPGGGRGGMGASPVGRLNSAAFNTFRNAAERGISNVPGSPTAGGAGESELFTVHQNTITSVRPYAGERGAVSQVSTSGVDGKLVVWDANAVTPISAAGLTGKLGKMSMR
ncbi:actin-like protein ARPC3 [Epithele typhae]|uniref:actin-like protein ARPC3 n=1 Tax=Epithele typhae TaxID=378194 RepID=UPI002008B757|nr:actin-like protein ARPC3 [Epithele typhae]KAH9945822.1 actin-like protein ARPC3 [Epithele typhae]